MSQPLLSVAGQSWVLKRDSRRKRVALRVDPEGCWCLAPLGVSDAWLAQFIAEHQAWWRQQLKQLPVIADLVPNQLWPYRNTGRVITPQDSPTSLKRWYLEQARAYLPQRLAYWANLMPKQPQGLKIRFYSGRWGSCNRRQELQLNWALMACPDAVIDYVIVHELAHLVHFNHSRAFWQLVEYYYPDYQQQACWLRREGHHYLTQLKSLNF